MTVRPAADMQTLLENVGFLTLVLLRLVLVAVPMAAVLWWWQRKSIGRRALRAQPPVIHLHRDEAGEWSSPQRAERVAAGLKAHGYSDVRRYAVPELPDVRIALALSPDRRAAAAICEHPGAGVWLDLWAQTADGRSVTVTDNRRAGGLAQPPWRSLVKLSGASVAPLLDALADAVPADAVAMEVEELPRRFEDEWAREVAWRSGRGLSVVEVGAVAAGMRGDR